jgi:hypothetical protein
MAASPKCLSAGWPAAPVPIPRVYRRDILGFVEFLGIDWPAEAFRLLQASVADVQAWRDAMLVDTRAPKTLNCRISSLSSFYK